MKNIPLVGRSKIIETITSFINADHGSVLILKGYGGIGKSRLLQEINNTYKNTSVLSKIYPSDTPEKFVKSIIKNKNFWKKLLNATEFSFKLPGTDIGIKIPIKDLLESDIELGECSKEIIFNFLKETSDKFSKVQNDSFFANHKIIFLIDPDTYLTISDQIKMSPLTDLLYFIFDNIADLKLMKFIIAQRDEDTFGENTPYKKIKNNPYIKFKTITFLDEYASRHLINETIERVNRDPYLPFNHQLTDSQKNEISEYQNGWPGGIIECIKEFYYNNRFCPKKDYLDILKDRYQDIENDEIKKISVLILLFPFIL